MEKLQLLKTPEERRRRLEEIPEIHADPKMDPSYESEDNDSDNEDARRGLFNIILHAWYSVISPTSNPDQKLFCSMQMLS